MFALGALRRHCLHCNYGNSTSTRRMGWGERSFWPLLSIVHLFLSNTWNTEVNHHNSLVQLNFTCIPFSYQRNTFHLDRHLYRHDLQISNTLVHLSSESITRSIYQSSKQPNKSITQPTNQPINVFIFPFTPLKIPSASISKTNLLLAFPNASFPYTAPFWRHFKSGGFNYIYDPPSIPKQRKKKNVAQYPKENLSTLMWQ